MLNDLNVTLVRAALLISERPLFFSLFLLSLFDSFFFYVVVVVILYNSCFSRRECDGEKIEKEK